RRWGLDLRGQPCGQFLQRMLARGAKQPRPVPRILQTTYVKVTAVQRRDRPGAHQRRLPRPRHASDDEQTAPLVAVGQLLDHLSDQPLTAEIPGGVLGLEGLQPSIRHAGSSPVPHPAQGLLPFPDGTFVGHAARRQYLREYVRLGHLRQVPTAVIVTEGAERDVGAPGQLPDAQPGPLSEDCQRVGEGLARTDPDRIGRAVAILIHDRQFIHGSRGCLHDALIVTCERTNLAHARGAVSRTTLYGLSARHGPRSRYTVACRARHTRPNKGNVRPCMDFSPAGDKRSLSAICYLLRSRLSPGCYPDG